MAKGSKDSKGAGSGGAGDNIRLAEVGQSLFVKAAAVGIAALAVSVFLGSGENDGWNRLANATRPLRFEHARGNEGEGAHRITMRALVMSTDM